MHEFHKIKLRSEKPKIIVNSYNPNNNSITTEKQQEQQKPSFFQRLFQKKNKKEEKKTEIKNDEIINTLQQPPIELLPFTNKKIKFISYNMNRLIYVTTDNEMYGMGFNSFGQLGCGDFIEKNTFTKIDFNGQIKFILCLYFVTVLINQCNEVFVCGNINMFKEYIQDKNLMKSENFIKTNIKLNELNGSIKFLRGKIVDQSLQNQEDEIIDLFPSFGHYLLFITKRNNIFVIGENKNELLGIDYSLCKNDTNLDKFMKLDWFTTNRKFISPILLENRIYLFTSNYKVNELEKENDLGSNCFQKAKQKQLCDCILVCV
ncbi:hypothetical protein ABK040_010688 [Willaertia magna]